MWKEIKWRRNKGKRMTKIMIGLGAGMVVLTAIILGLVYLDISASGSRSEDGRTLHLSISLGEKQIEDGDVVTARDANNDGEPIQLVAVCTGEGTELVSCTWIPLEESKRTPEEKALAERANNE